ncbi:MAG: hypothetical protein ACT4PT_14485 [Methanobacteriota archaeon]
MRGESAYTSRDRTATRVIGVVFLIGTALSWSGCLRSGPAENGSAMARNLFEPGEGIPVPPVFSILIVCWSPDAGSEDRGRIPADCAPEHALAVDPGNRSASLDAEGYPTNGSVILQFIRFRGGTAANVTTVANDTEVSRDAHGNHVWGTTFRPTVFSEHLHLVVGLQDDRPKEFLGPGAENVTGRTFAFDMRSGEEAAVKIGSGPTEERVSFVFYGPWPIENLRFRPADRAVEGG